MIIDFDKHRPTLYGIIVGLFSLLCAATGPLYEVYVDISVSPAQNIRRTDFSWITVNEWFTTQAYLIKSHNILKDVKSPISEKRLMEIISVRRLDSADIIRISARPDKDPLELQNAIAEIAAVYLSKLNSTGEIEQLTEKVRKEKGLESLPEAPQEEPQSELQDELLQLHAERGHVEDSIDETKSKLTINEKALNAIADNQLKVKSLKTRVAGLEGQIASMTQKYTSLRSTYTDDWPEVSRLKASIAALEMKKKEYDQELTAELVIAKEIENKKNRVRNQAKATRDELGRLRKDMASIDSRINEINKSSAEAENKETVVKEQAIPREEQTRGYILNPPTVNFLPELWARLIAGVLFGSLFWYIAVLIIRKKQNSAS